MEVTEVGSSLALEKRGIPSGIIVRCVLTSAIHALSFRRNSTW